MSIIKFRKCAWATILILQLGCEKTDPFDFNRGYDPYMSTVTVSAGDDIHTNEKSVYLFGDAKSADSAIWKYSWSKLEGPAGGIIENADSATTRITKLESGNYLFELKATGPNHKSKVDRISVFVAIIPDLPGTKIIKTDTLFWNDAMCRLPINDFRKLVPINRKFQLFIRPLNTAYWNHVKPEIELVNEGEYYYKNFGDFLNVYSLYMDCGWGINFPYEGIIAILP